MIDTYEIARRATEAQRWKAHLTSALAPLSERFRSAALKPADVALRGAFLRGFTEKDVVTARVQAVEELILRRRALVATLDESETSSAGGILSFNVDACFFDRVASEQTGGFFDDADLPPWDLWLAYQATETGDHVLLSWIPEEFRQLTDRAMVAHMANAYVWLTTPV